MRNPRKIICKKDLTQQAILLLRGFWDAKCLKFVFLFAKAVQKYRLSTPFKNHLTMGLAPSMYYWSKD